MPLVLLWGPSGIMLYNDAYGAFAGNRHPAILGMPVLEAWPEAADFNSHVMAVGMAGGTLEERVTSAGPLGAKEALEVLSDAAKGLVFAELRGIVHRDIKPANLMRDEVGTTKIADLGLATHLEAEATDEGGGKIFGTPHFIAPEQARGERVDARADRLTKNGRKPPACSIQTATAPPSGKATSAL